MVRKHYFTKNGISDFVITDFMDSTIIYINLNNGEQITYATASTSDAENVEKYLVKMTTDEHAKIIGCFDYEKNKISFFVNGIKI